MHFGSTPTASAERVESMFAAQKKVRITRSGNFEHLNSDNHVIERYSQLQFLNSFCDFAEKIVISEYKSDFKAPLKLVDTWDDDPIGSAGPSVVDHLEITKNQRREVIKIFHPFDGLIYENYPKYVYTDSQIMAIRDSYSTDCRFINELEKRESLAKATGKIFTIRQYPEIVWLDLTFKLVNWSLQGGYDSFVYINECEGSKELTFVCLLSEQCKLSGVSYHFNRDKYLTEMPAIFRVVAVFFPMRLMISLSQDLTQRHR